VGYWTPSQDTCTAECRATLLFDMPTRERVWDLVKAPAPVGYDPKIIPGWDSPASDAFAVLKIEPWRLRVLYGASMLAGKPEILEWKGERAPSVG
jgi:hypothetical protein